jgi:small conductance mechanosensitive channel
MSSVRYVATRAAYLIIVAVMLAVSAWILASFDVIPKEVSPVIFYAAITLVFGFWLTNFLSGSVVRYLGPKIGTRANTAGNLIKFFGYVVIAVSALSFFGVSPEVALAGGTFTGLIIGLGAQPLLSNFFAGVVLLLTGALKPGDEVRLVTTSLPYQTTTGMGYKFFSPDFVNVGYRGYVQEVGLLYSTMITETGLELKVPNQLILNSGIINYSSETPKIGKRQVRYEFSIKFDPDEVLRRIKDSLSSIEDVISVYISEQSDKQYYIVVIEFTSSPGKNWREIKSDILKKLISLQREFETT